MFNTSKFNTSKASNKPLFEKISCYEDRLHDTNININADNYISI